MVLSENVGVRDSSSLGSNSRPQAPARDAGIAIDIFVGGDVQTATDRFVEDLIQRFVAKHGTEAIIEAKEEFFRHGGKIFAEDDNYHQRIYYFLNHFIFERPLDRFNRSTPFLEYLVDKEGESEVDGFTHSLFKIIKIKPDHLILKDLFTDKRVRVQKQEHEVFEGISKGDVFQGILLHKGEFLHLSRGLVFHPAKAHKIILSRLKDERKHQRYGKDQLLFTFARQQLKHSRLKHVDPKLVYQENPVHASLI